jgi:ADP-ribose pyrophosphatase YjhB (NUDIX family)
MKKQRIAAAAIILNKNKILLVTYTLPNNKSFLVGPGGGIKLNESIPHAITREVKEETGIQVQPCKLLWIEDLLSKTHRMIKLWFLCKVIKGEIIKTKEAAKEGITNVAWYSKAQLKNKTVYPHLLVTKPWKNFSKKNWIAQYLPLKRAQF